MEVIEMWNIIWDVDCNDNQLIFFPQVSMPQQAPGGAGAPAPGQAPTGSYQQPQAYGGYQPPAGAFYF